MGALKILAIRDNHDYLQRAVDYFTAKWKIDRRIYNDCLGNSLTTSSPLPRWYLMLKDESIVGGYGLITNDFISRQDLYPWLCALYIEDDYRGKQLGAKLLEHGKAEAAKLGYKKLFLSTDLKGYYEQYGWRIRAQGYHPWEAESTIYEIDTEPVNSIRRFLGNPTLVTERLIIRTIEATDAEDVFHYAKQADVVRYLTWEVHQSIEDTHDYINLTREKIQKDKAGEWGLQLKETGSIIGAIGFVNFDQKNYCGELGYVISRHYRGQGLIPEAIKAIVQFAFEKMNLQRIEAMHYTENEASGRAMQKAGMRYEGLLRRKVFTKGKHWDVKLYAVTKDDFML